MKKRTLVFHREKILFRSTKCRLVYRRDNEGRLGRQKDRVRGLLAIPTHSTQEKIFYLSKTLMYVMQF